MQNFFVTQTWDWIGLNWVGSWVGLSQFKKMKIEGQRESNKIDAENDEAKTYYVVNNGRSRYDAWRNSRKNRDVKRSNSNNWRT